MAVFIYFFTLLKQSTYSGTALYASSHLRRAAAQQHQHSPGACVRFWLSDKNISGSPSPLSPVPLERLQRGMIGSSHAERFAPFTGLAPPFCGCCLVICMGTRAGFSLVFRLCAAKCSRYRYVVVVFFFKHLRKNVNLPKLNLKGDIVTGQHNKLDD